MKKTIFCALVALMAFVAPASAQDAAVYTSEVLGISVVVPEGAEVVQDSEDGLAIKTDDNQFALALIPFDSNSITPDEMESTLNTISEQAELNPESAEDSQFSSDTLTGSVKIGDLGGGVTCVGVLGNESLNTGYFISMQASEAYTGFVETILANINVAQ